MIKWKKVEFDDYYPQYLRDNKEKYSKFILDGGEPITNFIGSRNISIESM